MIYFKIVILDCVNSKHTELIKSKDAFDKLFERFFNNLKSLTIVMKTVCVMHSALQDENMSLKVAHIIKQKECLMYPYQKDN